VRVGGLNAPVKFTLVYKRRTLPASLRRHTLRAGAPPVSGLIWYSSSALATARAAQDWGQALGIHWHWECRDCSSDTGAGAAAPVYCPS